MSFCLATQTLAVSSTMEKNKSENNLSVPIVHHAFEKITLTNFGPGNLMTDEIQINYVGRLKYYHKDYEILYVR